jgi:cation-transporting ATPase 13A3/4/5
LWIAEEYYYYAFAIMVLAIGSLMSTVIEIRMNMKEIRRLALTECEVEVFRGNWLKVRSRYLVPGDFVRIPERVQLPCDLILLRGACLMDESMLTGESQPILKEPLPKIEVIYREDKKYLITSGTKALTCRGDTVGLVISTGFHTKKGELVRSILFPKPNRFKFYSDSIKFIGILALIALLGFLISLSSLISQKVGNLGLFFCSADLITIAVPPALPLAMTAGTAFAIARMRKKGISCISPPAVNSAGRVSIICFDKTGTLTEDSMKLKGVWEINDEDVQEKLEFSSFQLQESLASCHSLVRLNGILIGDPQEVAIFEHLDWEFFESEDNDNCRCKIVKGDVNVNVVQLFHFSSVTKRMGVVTECNGKFKLQVKGAPEVILPLCEGVPNTVYSNLLNFSQSGNRVLACAYKSLPSFNARQTLEELESSLSFLGLILLHNPLKAETCSTLETLLQANIRCVISTGDALLTAAAVGKACGIIDKDEEVILGSLIGEEIVWESEKGLRIEISSETSVAVVATGSLLEFLYKNNSEILDFVLNNGKVFGRMSPNQKVILVQLLQKEEILVAMVGDGANDCGALKAADVGLSIVKVDSQSGEASIAAPFSADGLQKVVDLLKEGRAALVTSFQCFKFITMYSMIQFVCINFLYFLQSNLMDFQYLYEDLFMILPLAVFMAYTGPSKRLTSTLPPGALISIPVLSSIVGQVLIQGTFQIIPYFILKSQPFYENQDSLNNVKKYEINAFSPLPAYENTMLFLISSIQLLLVCISFSIGKPFRQPAYRNYYFTTAAVMISIISFYIVVFPASNTLSVLQMRKFETGFRWMLFGTIMTCAVVTWVYERFGVGILTRFLRNSGVFRKKNLRE